MLRARCPSCGKSASFGDADAGQPVVCLACGARYLAPDPLAPATATDVESAPESAPVAGGPRVGRMFWVALVLGVVSGAGVLALVLRGGHGSPPANSVDTATVLTLASEARAAADAGRYVEAHQKYQQLESSLAGRDVNDPAVRRTVEQAMADKQRVYAVLLSQPGADQPQTSATAPSTSRPSTTPPAATEPSPALAAAESAAGAATPASAPASRPIEVTTALPAPAPVAPPQSSGTTTNPAPTTSPTAVVSTPSTRPVVAHSTRPAIRPMPEATDVVSDEQIGRAIQRGVDHLLSRFDPATHTLGGTELGGADGGGPNALAVYALMQCGQAINDPRLNVRGDSMNALIEAMKESRLRRGHPQTYATGIRATALSLFNRPQDRAVLRTDVLALIQSHTQGAYSYVIDPNRHKQKYPGAWDNSNSQYGLLGVWAGAEAAVEVPQAYWAAVEQHWVETQLPDGQWGYAGERGGRVSMTAAGIASLFVTHDLLDAPRQGRTVGREPFSPSLQRGLDWFETGDHSVDINSSYWGYTLYGIERVGLASGFKYFGQHDWYRYLAADVVARQAADGSWGDTVDTSFALLFLARGRHPILMNKVRFNGFWANRPRDVANLARYAAHQLERELNWQVVPLRPAKAWTDWLDSPILYIASHREPRLLQEDYDNLRQFVAAGGLLFTQADGDAAEFNKWASDLAAKLFSKYEMKDLPADHPIYNLVYKVDEDERPPLKGVSNGSRLLMVHSPVDLARAWQMRDTKARKGSFQLGVNLFLYAAGKRDLRNRLDSTFVSDPGQPLNGSTSLVRLEYAGNWNPEPAAWSRFSRWFQRQTGTGLKVSVMKMPELRPGAAAVAHLTGTARYDFTDADVAAAKAFVEAGGVLLIDQCGGTGAFDQSVTDVLLPRAFPGSTPAPLDPTEHPLFRGGATASGMDDLSKPRIRQFGTQGRVNEATPMLGFAAGKGHVIYTPIDVSSGLLGTRTWGIAGLHPDYAAPFVKNLLFWTMDGQPDQ